jgi:glycosyltransferase involved in cell wall biosynthesis
MLRQIIETVSSFPLGNRLIAGFLGRARASSFLLHQAVEDTFDFTKELRQSIDAYIVTSESIAEIETKYGVLKERIHILPHFLPEERLKKSHRPDRREGEKVRVGFFGRMAREKGFDLLVDALKHVEHEQPGLFDLWILSREGNLADILKRFGKNGVTTNRIRIINDRMGVDLNPVIADIDLCVIPSLVMEIGPLTLLEAIAQGVPCIVSDSVGMKTLITDGKNGLTFPVGSSDALGKALLKVLRQPSIIQTWRNNLPEILGQKAYISRLEHIFSKTIKNVLMNRSVKSLV